MLILEETKFKFFVKNEFSKKPLFGVVLCKNLKRYLPFKVSGTSSLSITCTGRFLSGQ